MHTERPTTAQARAAVIEEIAAPGRALAHRVLEASNAGDTDEAMAEARTNRDTTPRCCSDTARAGSHRSCAQSPSTTTETSR